jgi:hypothetical protein
MAAMQRHALTQAIEALGTIAPHLPPATFAPAVPVVLASLETLQNRACLVCIDQLASDPTNVELIFDANTEGHSATTSQWRAQRDEASGKEYFVNTETQESVWVKPAALGVQERMVEIGASSPSVEPSVGWSVVARGHATQPLSPPPARARGLSPSPHLTPSRPHPPLGGVTGTLDTIGTILQMLREGGDDPETSIPAFQTLATLALTPIAVHAIRDKGGVELTTDWLTYNLSKGAHLPASTAALQMLARVGAQDSATLDALLAEGKIEEISSNVFACNRVTPRLCAAFEAVVEVSVNGRPEVATDFVHQGRMRLLVDMYTCGDTQAGALCTEECSALGFIELARTMGQNCNDDLKKLMGAEGVPQLVMCVSFFRSFALLLSRVGMAALLLALFCVVGNDVRRRPRRTPNQRRSCPPPPPRTPPRTPGTSWGSTPRMRC